ncbi:MAG TPA: response regulator [Leptospiraceae bacterium]|nr:response regulator [Leptospiraceae bacterium]
MDSFSALILDQNDRSRTIISKMLDDLRIKNKSSANIELALSSLDSNVFNLLIINNNLTSFSEFLNKSNNFNVYNDSKFTTILLLESTVADWNEDFQYPSNIVKIFKPLRKKDLVDVLINRFPNIVRKSLIKQQETLYSMVNENLKIMIVDDDEVNLFLAKTVLDLVMPKAHIVQFNNGLEALKNIEKENPNIIFLDLQMPELNGIETTIEIRKINSFKEVPIIAFSAGMIPEDLEKCKDAGMNDYLTKPVKKEDFQRVLEKWLSK